MAKRPNRDRHPSNLKGKVFKPWGEERIKLLAELCLTTLSYGQIAQAINKAFPGEKPLTRCAVLGRVHRQGLKGDKPRSSVVRKSRPRRGTSDRLKLAKRMDGAPFNGSTLLREHPNTASMSAVPARRHGYFDPRAIEARDGFLPDIVEATETAVSLVDAKRSSCMWPASEDVRDMKVCGANATCGSYCDRHASLAYRQTPTRKRQSAWRKEDTDYLDGADRRGVQYVDQPTD